jgi:hypothetical protein
MHCLRKSGRGAKSRIHDAEGVGQGAVQQLGVHVDFNTLWECHGRGVTVPDRSDSSALPATIFPRSRVVRRSSPRGDFSSMCNAAGHRETRLGTGVCSCAAMAAGFWWRQLRAIRRRMPYLQRRWKFSRMRYSTREGAAPPCADGGRERRFGGVFSKRPVRDVCK